MTTTQPIDSPWQWCAWCVALILPTTAVFHHAVFYRGSCMINPFGLEYTRAAVWLWLREDPSLRWGLVVAGAAYCGGLLSTGAALRVMVPAIVIGFVPTTVWIWDIPGSRRWICRHFHDDLLVLPLIGPLRTRHIYIVSVVLSGVAFAMAVT